MPSNRFLFIPDWRLAMPLCLALAACGQSTPPVSNTGVFDDPAEFATTGPGATGAAAMAPAGGAEPGLIAAVDPAKTTSAPSMTDAEIAAIGARVQGAPHPSRHPRPFGFLFKRAPGGIWVASSPAVGGVLALDSDPEIQGEPVARRGWLFGRRDREVTVQAAPAAFSLTDPEPRHGGVTGQPFGKIATICGVSPRDLGTEVARSPGAGTYRLYDSIPGSIDLRPQFLIGFEDKCARQFTASLAMFGSPRAHETTRYNPLNTNPYSQTDQAYENVKIQLCGVQSGVGCPVRKLDRLARQSAFVSVYRDFGESGDWLEMFLHDGKVAAFETRTN